MVSGIFPLFICNKLSHTFCICVYLLVLLFRFGRVVRHWAGCAETSTALHSALPTPPLEFSPPWARGQDPSLSSTTGSGKRAFLSRLSNFTSPRRLKPLSCTSHLSHGLRKDFHTQKFCIPIMTHTPDGKCHFKFPFFGTLP